MITSIHLQNFKAHRDTTVPLGKLTVLVGPNGSGKTSVLQALQILTEVVEKNPHQVLCEDRHLSNLAHCAGGGATVITATATDDSNPWTLAMEARLPEETQRNKGVRIVLSWDHGQGGKRDDSGKPFRELVGDLPLAEAVGNAVLYRFDARRIAAVTYNPAELPVVGEDGSDTAGALAALKLEQEELFEVIEEELRRVVPNVERIRIRRVSPSGGTHPVGHKIYLDFRGAPGVPAHAASEGTLITLALLTALCSPTGPSLVLLDDLDHALHPQAQAELVRNLKRLLEGLPDTQIVASTHSPYILDELDPADVQVFALREDGSVATKRLSEHPQAAQMGGALSAGQLWSLDPEKSWVLEEG